MEPDAELLADLDRLELLTDYENLPPSDPPALTVIATAFAARAGINVSEAKQVVLSVVMRRAGFAS